MTDADTVGPLPDAVRARVITLAADALGRLPAESLPAPLKRVAAFAPGRRAKLAGTQIAGVIESDDDFRQRLGTQVRAAVPEVVEALEAGLEAGRPPAALDPAEAAAVAYLVRPEGWERVVGAAAEAVSAERASVEDRQSAEQVERLRRQLDHATEELKSARRRHRDEIAALKADNADLRRKLGDARARTRAAEEEAGAAAGGAEEQRRAASAATAAAEAEARRLRSRVEELEAEQGAQRRADRVERGSEAMRARLLLDTLHDAVQGLRRELALPATEGSPADLVEAHVAEEGSRSSSGQGSLTSDDPALLDQLLGLPRAHMIVDGYNVTKSAWPELALEKQRDRLLTGLAPLVARTGAEVTVVFDAADKEERPPVTRPRGVRVLFSPVGVIADDVIRELVAAEPRGRPVVVVTSDQAVVRDVAQAGSRSVAARALSRLLARG